MSIATRLGPRDLFLSRRHAFAGWLKKRLAFAGGSEDRESGNRLLKRLESANRIEMRLERSRHGPLVYQAAVRERFRVLASQWTEETQFVSSAREMASHPAYRSIIELGWPVVPCLLRDLRDTGNHWFLALREITGENPVAPEDRGYVDRMTRAWLDWGYSKNLLERPAAPGRE